MEVQYQPLSRNNRTIYNKILLLLAMIVLMGMVIVISSIGYIIYVENASKSEENFGFSMLSLMGWSSRNYLPKRWFEEKKENEFSTSTAEKLSDEAEILGTFSNNGLALTPLMGWSSRKHLMSERSFGDEIENDYSTSEKVIENTAEILHKEGYSKVGYNYIIIDESWSASVRDKDGNIEPDHKRFPKGIKNLAKNLHKLDLKLGISGDIGSETCSGHPGSWANFDRDAKTFAAWEIDLLKVNGCFANESMLNEGYKNFGKALINTKRPIIYSIDWPLHDRHVNFTEVVKISNLWRVYHNVHDTFKSIMSVVDYVGANPNIFRKYSGPGSWADLDVLAIGNSHLSLDQSKLQMAMWSIFPAPLVLVNNLKNIRKEFKDILVNNDVISVNQDSLGLPGKRIHVEDNIEVWIRQISPVQKKGNDKSYSYALVILNRQQYGKPIQHKFTPEEYGMKHKSGYQMKELFHKFMNEKHVMPNTPISFSVDASSVVFLRFELKTSQSVDSDKNIFSGLL